MGTADAGPSTIPALSWVSTRPQATIPARRDIADRAIARSARHSQFDDGTADLRAIDADMPVNHVLPLKAWWEQLETERQGRCALRIAHVREMADDPAASLGEMVGLRDLARQPVGDGECLSARTRAGLARRFRRSRDPWSSAEHLWQPCRARRCGFRVRRASRSRCQTELPEAERHRPRELRIEDQQIGDAPGRIRRRHRNDDRPVRPTAHEAPSPLIMVAHATDHRRFPAAAHNFQRREAGASSRRAQAPRQCEGNHVLRCG